MKTSEKKPVKDDGENQKTVRSRITNKVPGLTKGKKYKFIRWGWWEGAAYFVIINDRGETMSIYDPEKYLHTEDLKKGSKKDA